jgi:LacI family transcriptional regulator
VAKLAGVSPATVSRVLNQSPSVSVGTRERIQTAIDSLNYVRDGVAKSFTQRRSGSVGVIIPALGTSVYADAVEAIERRLQLSQYRLLTACSGYDPHKEYELARAFVEHGVDGLILVGSDHLPELYQLVRRAGIPAIQTFVHAPTSALPSVGFDNFGPVVEMTRYLLDFGHTEFAILHSPLAHNDRIATRLRAIVTALGERGIAPHPELVVEAGYTVAEGRAGLRALLASGRRFTAIACTGDVIAIGALIEARSAGIDVPAQLSVSGFHDYDLAAQIEPPLTTVHAPIKEMSSAAAQFLLSTIAGENPPKFRELATALVVRKSVGPVPGKSQA